MEEKALSRRAFVGGLAAAGLAGWLYDSDSLSARLVRAAFSDAAREAVPIAPAELSGWTTQNVDICWVGHATVLINLRGVRILTDPVFFNRIGLQTGIATLGRKRLVASALDPHHLPRIDLVLLSHAHMDHLDMASIGCIGREVPVVTARRTGDLLDGFGFKRLIELGWGERAVVETAAGEVCLTGVEVRHWGARWSSDTFRGYNGYLMEREGRTLLFGGDTAYTDSLAQLKSRRIEAAIMPIGCYGRSSQTHCTPEEAVKMTDSARAEFIVPVHHSTFPLGREPISEPLERLERVLSPDRIGIRRVGETWRVPC